MCCVELAAGAGRCNEVYGCNTLASPQEPASYPLRLRKGAFSPALAMDGSCKCFAWSSRVRTAAFRDVWAGARGCYRLPMRTLFTVFAIALAGILLAVGWPYLLLAVVVGVALLVALGAFLFVGGVLSNLLMAITPDRSDDAVDTARLLAETDALLRQRPSHRRVD